MSEVPGSKKKKSSSTSGGKVQKNDGSMQSNISVTYKGDVVEDSKNTEETLSKVFNAKRRGEVLDFSLESRNSRTGSNHGKFNTFKIPVIEKSDESKQLIREALEKNVLFNDLTDIQYDMVVNSMKQVKVTKGTKLIEEGSVGDHFYVVNSGSFSFSKKEEGVVGKAAGGESFGELALLYNAPRAVSVICDEAGEVWCLDRTTFKQIVSRSNDDEAESIRTALLNTPVLTGLTGDQIEALVDAVHVQTYAPGDVIITKGSNQKIFYIIKEGDVVVTKAGKNLNELVFSKGDYFGERALLNDEPRAANVIARTKVECLALDAESFHTILGDLKELLSHNFGMRVLKSVPIFADLTDEQHEKIYESMTIESFEKGKTIVKQGDVGRKFYIIKDGQVEVLKQNGEKKSSLKVTSLSSGQFFGEGALISDDPRTADIVATTDVQCFTINRSAFEKLFGGPLKEMIEEIHKKRNLQLNGSKQVFHSQNIKFNDLKIIKTLGTGTFGRVKLVVHEKTGNTYALKVLQKAQIIQYRQQSNVINEKNVMKNSDHPFILKLYETYKDSQCLYMLLELIQGGELFNLLQQKGGKIPNLMARFYTACVVDAFHYLHDRYIVYRDLKPENLMIDTVGYIRVVDFGFAKKVKKKTYTLCGTPEYLAPELVLGKGHNKGVDLWAVGILIYEMLQGSSPFADMIGNNQMQICKNIVKGTYSFPKSFPSEAKDLVKAFLKRDPSQRIGMLKGGAQDIKNHEWFHNFAWDALRAKEMESPWKPMIKDPLDTSNFDSYEEDEVVEHYEEDDEGRWDKF